MRVLVLRTLASLGIAGVLFGLPGCVGGGGGENSADRGAEMTLSLPKNLQMRPGQPAQLAINVTNSPGLAGIDLEISYDAGLVSISNIGKGGMTQGFLISGKAEGGALRIHLAAADNASRGAGTIAVAQIEAAANARIGQTTPLKFQDAQAYDQTTKPLNPRVFDGQVSFTR